MSHFFGIVLIPGDTKKKHIEGVVSDLVEDYNEQKDVPEYEEDCPCVGRKARNEAREETARRLGTVDQLRHKFWSVNVMAAVPVKEAGTSKEEWEDACKKYNEADKANTTAWKKALEPLQEMEDRLFANHPEAKRPNPECTECRGKGRRTSTGNPNGYWDWWTIGGRWTGALTPDYDPTTDPRNLETCRICNGTGKRDDALGKEERKRNPAYTCNGCDGKGQSVKFSLAKHNGDVMPASKVPKDVVPFCIVTPDGTWHQKAQMGWWGMTSDEKDEDDWNKIAVGLLEKHKDCLAVVVDYHV